MKFWLVAASVCLAMAWIPLRMVDEALRGNYFPVVGAAITVAFIFSIILHRKLSTDGFFLRLGLRHHWKKK